MGTCPGRRVGAPTHVVILSRMRIVEKKYFVYKALCVVYQPLGSLKATQFVNWRLLPWLKKKKRKKKYI